MNKEDNVVVLVVYFAAFLSIVGACIGIYRLLGL
jgi:hypothetical protein